jgi:hypothetical protein
MKYLEVDINFSLDYKNGDNDILSKMLQRACKHREGEINIQTLDIYDFFIHLCAHLYKEATTLPWIEMHRDMTLYKYCDIYLLLAEMSHEQLEKIFERAINLKMEKICAYTVLETMELFDIADAFALNLSYSALEDDHEFRFRVVSPKDKKTFSYKTASATDRFFMESRTNDLKEIINNEKT